MLSICTIQSEVYRPSLQKLRCFRPSPDNVEADEGGMDTDVFATVIPVIGPSAPDSRDPAIHPVVISDFVISAELQAASINDLNNHTHEPQSSFLSRTAGRKTHITQPVS